MRALQDLPSQLLSTLSAALFVLSLAAPSAYAAAQNEDNGPPLNFETQLVHIFEVAQTAPDLSPDHAATPDDRAVLSRILDKLRHHQMLLKNVVYRKDMAVIRVTWADDHNDDVVKVAYKTGQDRVLGNSVYADKRQITDVKIMYKKTPEAYDYLLLLNMDVMLPHYGDAPAADAAPPPPLAYNYSVESKLTNEKCRFCHTLAKNDGMPAGIFFPRYQETYKDRDNVSVNHIFHAETFEAKPASAAKDLGLPAMSEDFIYRRVSLAEPDPSPEAISFARTLIELPQLIEVMARDNQKSTCIAVDFGEDSEKQGFGRNDYVCADNGAHKLYVKLTDAALTANKASKEYTEPYFEKK